MNSELEPKLAPPGAGLPRSELLIGRWLFTLRRATGGRALFNARFEGERETIRTLVRPLDPDSAARRVLIERPRGMEDSSRFWSVWMTLDHLRIVHQSVIRVIGALSKGVELEGMAGTANVKPGLQVKAAVVAGYEKSCDDLLATVEAVGNLNTPQRYTHPWFGPLNAAGWHALAAEHHGIHRVQVQRIIQGLSAVQQ